MAKVKQCKKCGDFHFGIMKNECPKGPTDESWDYFKTRPGYQYKLGLYDDNVRIGPKIDAAHAVTEKLPGWLSSHTASDPHGETHCHFGLTLGTRKKVVTDRPGYVYFIQNVANGLIKIGRSKNPESRMESLQTGNGFDLRLLAKMFTETMVEDEIWLHSEFDQYRVRGEWFFPDKKIVEFITEIGGTV